jgi:hypothetical protein
MQKANLYFLLLLFSIVALSAGGAVGEYSFTSTPGTFTEISGGTVLGTAVNDNESFNAIPLGFTFTYNGVDYTDVSIQSNGFLAMGLTVATSNVAISAATGTNNIVAALNRDIKGRDNGELMYLLSGTAPARVFTVQWKHYRRVPTATANDDLTFQIQLLESGSVVRFVYGPITAVTSAVSAATQVGLRGDTNADFNNRTTTTDWSATTAGTANNSNCTLSATVFPASGLTFAFTPPAIGEPPEPAQNPFPANAAINVAIGANLSWSPGSGTIDGYKVFLGTDNPPTNIVNGTSQTALSYDPADFTYSTTYYWQIVPFNTNGDALACPVWSFSTLADPTVSTFPYHENFDNVTPPALPPGWTTINANNDAYTWETYAGNYHTQPNSARIRYNQNLAMNDWLLMPPIQLTGTTPYKVKFSYRATSNTLPEKLALYWGNAPTVAGLTEQIFANEDISQITYTTAEVIVTPQTSGVYYFGFKGYSNMDMFYLYLDTVSIEVFVEILNPPTNLSATVSGLDVHLAWSAPVISRALLGYKVFRNNTLIATLTDPATISYDDTGLSSGLYSYGVKAVYTTGESVFAGPVLADVDPVLLPPSNLTGVAVERDVSLSWDNPEGDWISWSQPAYANAVGTSSAAVFDVAHRWTQEDLAPYAGRSISRIQFVPTFASCTYTVKVWTGGSATSAGTLVHSQVVPTVVLGEWNTVFLNALVPIPTTGDVYYGYECNTTGGNPAGCDAGPPIEGKGNMMYFGGAWTTLATLAPTLTYNWSIRAFTQITAPPANAELPAVMEISSYNLNPDNLGSSPLEPGIPERNVTGYKVYRDNVLIATINDAEIQTYLDAGLPNATYTYGVTTTSPNGESLPSTVEVVVNFQLATEFFADGFESYPDFATTFSPWILRDMDHFTTVGIPGVEFPGSTSAMSYIIFNPSATTPPITDLSAHSGAKMAASFTATTSPNNDFLVSPHVQLGTDSSIKFFARSHDDTAGLARFRVGVCTLPSVITQGFTYVSGPDYIEAPVGWTEYVYDLSAYDGQLVFVGIRCVSGSSLALYVDDVSLHSNGGTVGVEDGTVAVLANELVGNYPNPFNPETTIRYNTAAKGPVSIEIFNLKGQRVKTLVNDTKEAGSYAAVWNGLDSNNCPVSSGVYFYKMNAGKYSATRKMIMMK